MEKTFLVLAEDDEDDRFFFNRLSVRGFVYCGVFIYSTTLDNETEQVLMNAGAFACFVKPATPVMLAAKLQKMCNL